MSENLLDNSTSANSNPNNTAANSGSGNNVAVNSNSDTNAAINLNSDTGTAPSSNSDTGSTVSSDLDNNIAINSSHNTGTAANSNSDTGTADVNTEHMPQNNAPVKKEPKYQFEQADIIMLPVIFILAFLCTKYYSLVTTLSTLGLGASIYVVLYVASLLIYAGLKSVKANKESMILSVLMILLSLSFTVFYNHSLNVFMQIAMNFMLIYLPVTIFNKLIKKETSALILYDYINALVFIPIYYATSFWLCMFSKKEKTAQNKKAKYFMHIFLGLLIGTPFIVIVIFLLSSADATFNKIFENLFTLNINISENFVTVIWSLPMATYLYALIYGSSVIDNSKYFNMDKFNQSLDNAATIPRLSIYTVNVIICCFYVLFIGIQAVYFIDIAGGSLPDGFTYSDYARRGFFELLTVALINIVFIVVAKVLSIKHENNKYMRIHIILNSILTFALIFVAFAKMYLYISTYGLTALRIIPSTFMIFLCCVFAFIIMGEFKQSFPVVKLSFYTGNILFVLLCIINMDGLVAQYNLNAYVNGKLPYYDLYELKGSDLSAIPAIYKVWKNTDDEALKTNLSSVAESIMKYKYFDEDEYMNYNYVRNKALEIKKHMHLN